MPRFTDSTDMIGQNLINGSSDPGHAHQEWSVNSRLSLNIFHLHAKFGDSLSLQPFRRYACGRRNWKWIMWPWPRLF